ncbi:spore germination protein [Paenibacillus koleovorans]|uniref:spore germination protein n=1 Tax=Paenibacillus koleovorans TaxID=121608 RepID=UPI000FDA3892|nr:spore germination protein [Paenibacillus koleovorans]
MPSIVGNVKILSVGPSSVVQFGDAINISPVSSSKTYAGAGSFNTGDTFGPALTNNAASISKVNDQDVVDSSPKTVEA